MEESRRYGSFYGSPTEHRSFQELFIVDGSGDSMPVTALSNERKKPLEYLSRRIFVPDTISRHTS
jgi:hypothetical protein